MIQQDVNKRFTLSPVWIFFPESTFIETFRVKVCLLLEGFGFSGIDVLSGKFSKMHLRLHTNSEAAGKLYLTTTSLLSLCCFICHNWSSVPDNPVLSALISSQACLSLGGCSQMDSLKENFSYCYFKLIMRQTGKETKKNWK